jgi:hypothetical protein
MATETVETVKTKDGKTLEVHTINGVTVALSAKDAEELKRLTSGQPDESIDWLYWGKIAVGVIVAGVAIYFGAKYLSSESEVVHIDVNNI